MSCEPDRIQPPLCMIHRLNTCCKLGVSSRLLSSCRAPGHRPAVHAIMAQKSITAFFQTTEKRNSGTAADGKIIKKVASGAVAIANDGSTETEPVASTIGCAPAAEEAAPPAALSTEELRDLAEKAQAVAELRVQQAAAQGVPVRLADLLVDDSWREALGPEFIKPYMSQLQTFLAEEWAKQQIYPPQPFIFRAFNSCPLDQARVVIIGQDPYHNTGQAMGLSFSVPPGKAVPSSLQNMYKELADDCGCRVPRSGDLRKWTHQGVFLLNACLTVRAHAAASHSKKGWEEFTDAAIRALSARRSGLVFLLWGRFAQQKRALVDARKHHILTAAHPSGFSANKGFFGCKHFSKANALLAKEGLPPIDWQIE